MPITSMFASTPSVFFGTKKEKKNGTESTNTNKFTSFFSNKRSNSVPTGLGTSNSDSVTLTSSKQLQRGGSAQDFGSKSTKLKNLRDKIKNFSLTSSKSSSSKSSFSTSYGQTKEEVPPNTSFVKIPKAEIKTENNKLEKSDNTEKPPTESQSNLALPIDAANITGESKFKEWFILSKEEKKRLLNDAGVTVEDHELETKMEHPDTIKADLAKRAGMSWDELVKLTAEKIEAKKKK